MSPGISVLIRLYNGIEFLHDSLYSVMNQTYEDWEVIIGVNGHGPDGGDVFKKAATIVESIGQTHLKKIRLKNYPDVNGGAEVMNAMAKDANAEWVAILDVDDRWHPMKLLRQVYFLRMLEKQPDVIGTRCLYFDKGSGGPDIPHGYIEKSAFKIVNPMINSSVVMRRDLVAFADHYGLDDYDLWIRLSRSDKVFYNIYDVLTYHRIRPTSFYNASGRQDVEGLRKHYFG